jgi:hypothetical protein
MRKEPAKTADEYDWITGWRRWLRVFKNHTGLGKAVKRAMSKRARRRAKREIEKERDQCD